MFESQTGCVGLVFFVLVGQKIILKKGELYITALIISVSVFSLDACLIAELQLAENICDFICLVCVFTPAVGIKISIATA